MSEKLNGTPYGRERRLLFYLTFLNYIYLFTLSYVLSQPHQCVRVQVVWAGLLVVAWRTRGASCHVPTTSAVFLWNGDKELWFQQVF